MSPTPDYPTSFKKELDDKGRVVIPKECRTFLGVDPGGTVVVAVARTREGLRKLTGDHE